MCIRKLGGREGREKKGSKVSSPVKEEKKRRGRSCRHLRGDVRRRKRVSQEKGGIAKMKGEEKRGSSLEVLIRDFRRQLGRG